MAKKGWNEQYLSSKIMEYKKLSEEYRDSPLEAEYETYSYIYQTLYFKLISQKGFVCYSNISTEDFLKEFNGMQEPYHYNEEYAEIFAEISRQFIELPYVAEQKTSSKIKRAEALDIVGEFIKDCFDDQSYQIYVDLFKRKKDYILFDKLNETPVTTITPEKELFVSVPARGNISLVSQLAHEAGHVKRIRVNENMISENVLLEFESFSYEVRLLYWMIKNGIYLEDACKSLLNLMTLLEREIIVRYYNNLYHLNEHKDKISFEEHIKKLDLINIAHLKNMQDLFDAIASSYMINNPMYLYSFLCVIDNLEVADYYERYNAVIYNLGVVESETLAKKILTRDITDLSMYKKYREDLVKKLY